MTTYTTTYRPNDGMFVSQSRVIHTGTGPIHPFSLQIQRKRSRYGKTEKRGFNVWLYLGPIRLEVGTR